MTPAEWARGFALAALTGALHAAFVAKLFTQRTSSPWYVTVAPTLAVAVLTFAIHRYLALEAKEQSRLISETAAADPDSVSTNVDDVTGDRGDAAGDGREVDAKFGALRTQSIERVVLEDFTVGPACGTRSLTVAHEQHELAVGHRSEQALDERRADEPGRAGDGDPFPGERFGDHS